MCPFKKPFKEHISDDLQIYSLLYNKLKTKNTSHLVALRNMNYPINNIRVNTQRFDTKNIIIAVV